MKKNITITLIILLLFLLCACSASSLKTGTYSAAAGDDLLPSPYITIEDNNRFSFVYSFLSSYIPMGTYEVKNGKLILSAEREDQDEHYVFDITDGKLIYRQSESTPIPDFAAKEMYNGIVFEYSGN